MTETTALLRALHCDLVATNGILVALLDDGTPKYGATMIRDGEVWDCEYDYMYGAGFEKVMG